MPQPYQDELALLVYVKTTLAALLWPVDSTKIFAPSSVRITFGSPLESIAKMQEPAALIKPGPGTADPDEPLLMDGLITVTLVNKGGGDEIGENVVIGSHQRQDKGLLHVARQVLLALAKTTRDNGIQIELVAQSEGDGTLDAGTVYIAWRAYTFKVHFGIVAP